MSKFEMTKLHPPLIVISLFFVVFGYLRLNDTSIYTDSTRYVIWGTSFSHARGFVDDTQPDPERYVVNAPFYSIVLSPVLLIFPYSLTAAKILTLLIGVCSLILFYVWLTHRFGKTYALVGTLLLASNPLMFVMATEAMSETTFIALIILAMILLESFEPERSITSGTSVYLLIILAILPVLREVSITFVAAFVVVLIAKKSYRNAALIAIAAALVVAGWMIRNMVVVGIPSISQSTNVNFIFGHFVTSGDTSLVSELIQRIIVNVKSFYIFTISLLLYPFPQSLIVDPGTVFRAFFRSLSVAKYILPFIVLPLMLTGIIQDRKRGPKANITLMFFIFYFGIIVLYPVQDVRFLLPLLPFLIYYVMASVRYLFGTAFLRSGKTRMGLTIVATALIVIPNITCDIEVVRTDWQYEHSPTELYEKITHSVAKKELFIRPWKPFGTWIKQNIPDSVVIASTFKELSIFIGDRKILEINYGVPTPMFERFLRDYGVEYVISAGMNEYPRPYEFIMKETKRYWFEPVHSLSGLVLYRVHHSLIEPPPTEDGTSDTHPDSTTARGMLDRGRTLLLNGKYADAIAEFNNAGNRGINPTMVAYQMTIAYAMSSQQVEASKWLQKLYSMPQSTSYIPAARMHLQAMDTYRAAGSTTDLYQRSSQLFDVAALYWNFGYRSQGFSLLRDILQKDTTNFVSLLWGWDYAMELGNEHQAASYLKTLVSIDRTNAVVKGFRAITAINDTLRRTKNPRERSRLVLDAARTYSSIGLPDEAFDQVERSIAEDRTNDSAYRYLIELFETINKPWAIRATKRFMAHNLGTHP